MENKLFTVNDDRTLQEMLDNYHQKQKDLEEMVSLDELTEEQEKIKNEIAEEVSAHKNFISDMNKSLDFALATTSNQLVIIEDNGKRVPEAETKSTLEKEDYASLITALTDGMNPDLTLELDRARAENFSENVFYSSPKEFEQYHLAPIGENSVLRNEIENLKEQKSPDGVLVCNAVRAIDETKELANEYAVALGMSEKTIDEIFHNEEHELSLSEMTDIALAEYQNERLQENLKPLVTAEEKREFNTVDLVEVQSLYNDGYRSEDKQALVDNLGYNERKAETVCIVLDEMERNGITPELLDNIERAVKDNDLEDNGIKVDTDIEIVESNDGYVIATGKITPENENAYNSKVREATGNEVVKNAPPEETTTDLSRVGGDIGYEAVDEKGSIEEEQGYETPREIAVKEDKAEKLNEEVDFDLD